MRRFAELDAVRGFAAVAIMVFHMDSRLLPSGWVAVDLFMMLSGFLINLIVLTNNHHRRFLVNFYIRRGLRIWPSYYLTLLAVFFLPLIIGKPLLESLPYYLTFTQNIPYYWANSVPTAPSHFFHTWSLAVEEQYYLVWPALLLLLGRRSLAPLSVAIIVLCVYMRGQGTHFSLLVTRCDGFALGGLLAFLVNERMINERRSHLSPLAFSALGFIALGASFGISRNVFTLTGHLPKPILGSLWMFAVNMCFFSLLGLLVLYADHPVLKPLRSRFPCYLGRVSYGLYLYHPIVYRAIDRASTAIGIADSLLLYTLKIAITLFAAAVSWIYLERPLTRLKVHFPYDATEQTVSHVSASPLSIAP